MNRKRESVVWLICFFLIITAFVMARAISTEWRAEVEFLKQKNNLLLEDIELLEHEKELLENILLRDKQKINELLEEIEELRIIRARVTAYSPTDNQSGICADDDPTVTATGTIPREGVIAVDPRKIPYGTKLEIPGYGTGVAEDTGGGIRSYEGVAIDLFMPSHEMAMAWGIKELDVVLQR